MSKTAPKSQLNGLIPPQKPISRRRRFIYICLWLIWSALLALAIIAAYGWTQRYSYLERGAKAILADNNIAAELKIIEVTKTKARLEAVSLRDNETNIEVFSAVQIEARYDWREALNGRIDELIFTKPNIMLELDENGQMIGGWIPPTQSGSDDEMTFPKAGLRFQDGQLNLKTPYGDVTAGLNAHIFSANNFTAELELNRAELSYNAELPYNRELPYNDVAAAMAGPIAITVTPQRYDVHTELALWDVKTPSLSAAEGRFIANLSGVKDAKTWQITGPLSLALGALESEAVSAEWFKVAAKNSDLTLPLSFDKDTLALRYAGDVDVSGRGLIVNGNARRKDLAATLSLAKLVSKSPILREFAPALTAQTQDRLSRQDIEARLSVNLGGGALDITAQAPITFSKAGQDWTIIPATGRPLLSMTTLSTSTLSTSKAASDDDGARYKGVAHFSFVKPAPLPLTLDGAHMAFTLSAFTQLDAVTAFSGALTLPQSWEIDNTDGALTALTAEKTDIDFTRKGARSVFKAKADFTLTGEVPGGRITGAHSQGDLKITSQNGQSQIEFSPHKDIAFARMDLTSGWILEDGALSLSKPFIMTGPPARRVIDLDAAQINMRLHDGAERDFQLTMDAVIGQGVLTGAQDTLAQDWDMVLSGAGLSSPNFPVIDMDVYTPRAELKINMRAGGPPMFDIKSPQTRMGSGLLSADKIAISARGTTENLTVDYDAERFIFADAALPEIPMAGQARLAGGRWTGDSTARLPEDPTTPIDVRFSFEDGAGRADVNIAALEFSREKLQPQNLIAALRGKIGDVEGIVSTSIAVEFGEGKPLRSSGRAVINDLDFGVLAGPITGLTTELEFTSMFPLETSGRQFVKVKSFDPGFPLQDGEIEFELLAGKMKIYRAEWPLAGGKVSIEPLTWDFSAAENIAVLVLENIAIQDMMATRKDSKFEVTGQVSGRLPVKVAGVAVNVEGGKLTVPGGGSIRVKGPDKNLAGGEIAFDALKNFKYETLEADINGPLDGLIRLRTLFSGFNPDLYGGQPFEFDVDLQGELLNLIRELNPETQRKRALTGEILSLTRSSNKADN